MPRSVHVLGAGIVGICVALHLQRQGWSVTLVDRGEPGEETSFGHAGIVSRGSVLPPNGPAIWRSIGQYASNRHPAVRYRMGYLLRNAGWTVGFFRNATAAQSHRASDALNALIAPVVEAHRALLEDSGALGRLRQSGWLKLYRSEKGFQGSAFERSIYDKHGIAYDVLDARQIVDLEPCLRPIFRNAVHVTGTASVDNPGAVAKAYAGLFVREGGRLDRLDVRSAAPADGRFVLRTGAGGIIAENLVVALGPWSADFLSSLGYRTTLGFERGYHRHFAPSEGGVLSLPFHDVERGYVLAPVERGYRLTTGDELADRDAPPSPAQLEAALPAAREALEFGDTVDPEPWMGSRPSTPDGLPIIGRAPRHERLWLAFGHGHIGFSTAPVTGAMLTALMNDDAPAVPHAPFEPARLIR